MGWGFLSHWCCFCSHPTLHRLQIEAFWRRNPIWTLQHTWICIQTLQICFSSSFLCKFWLRTCTHNWQKLMFECSVIWLKNLLLWSIGFFQLNSLPMLGLVCGLFQLENACYEYKKRNYWSSTNFNFDFRKYFST